jgi:hypothetical protein
MMTSQEHIAVHGAIVDEGAGHARQPERAGERKKCGKGLRSRRRRPRRPYGRARFTRLGSSFSASNGHLLGLPTEIRVADPGDALLFLERKLPELPLDHYLQLYEPAFALRDILSAISRQRMSWSIRQGIWRWARACLPGRGTMRREKRRRGRSR